MFLIVWYYVFIYLCFYMFCYIHQAPVELKVFYDPHPYDLSSKFLKAIEQGVKVRAQSCVISKSWLAGSEMRCLHTVMCTARRTAHGRATATTLPVSNYTAEPPHLRAGARLEFATRPDLLFRAETAYRIQRVGATPPRGGGVSWGRNPEEHCRAAERHWKSRPVKPQQQQQQQRNCRGRERGGGVKWGGWGGFPPDPHPLPSPDMMVPQPDLLTCQCVWARVFTVKMCTEHVEAHCGRGGTEGMMGNGVNRDKQKEKQAKEKRKKQKKSTRAWLRNQKRQRTRVTKSLAFFLKNKRKKTRSFSMVASRPETLNSPPPPPPSPLPDEPPPQTVSRHGIFSGQCSPCCCSCSALWDLRFRYSNYNSWLGAQKKQQKQQKNVSRPSATPTDRPTNWPTDWPTNRLGLYIVCVNAYWELSHAAQHRKKKTNLKVTSILFCSYCLYVCAWGSVCVYLKNCHPMWKWRS